MIQIGHLSKRYASTLALDDLSFTVSPGNVTGFLGPNGAGKTTTFRILLGLASPTSGAALVNGRRYHDIPHPLFEVGALLDATAIDGGRTALDHLRWLARSHRIGDGRVRDEIERAGLAGVADTRVAAFSLGMKQRLGIAAAMLGDPATLVLDEPVNGLDPEGVRWIRGLLRSLAAEGRTILVSSHLMSEMAITADRLVVISRGRLVAEAATSDLTEMRQGARVRTARPAELAQELVGHGGTVSHEPDGLLIVHGLDPQVVGSVAADALIPLTELSPIESSLEDAYMSLVAGELERA